MARQISATFSLIISTYEGQYLISAKASNRIQVDPQIFSLDLSDSDKKTLQMIETEPRHVMPEALIALGRALYKSMFLPEIAMEFGRLQQRLQGETGVRIRLVITPPELIQIPWELMHDGRDFIALRSNYPIVRTLETGISIRNTTIVSGPLRILYAWSAPQELQPLNLEDPALQLGSLLQSNKRIQFDILPHATLEDLRRALLHDYHILCFAGHGTSNHIYLEGSNGLEKISADTLARDLEGKSTQLVFLAACETGGFSPDGLRGFAQSLLLESEVPAIVAMQYEVYDKEANELTARFFETLSAFRPVDVALAEARKAITDEHKTIRDVFAPVMYLQGSSSELFQRARNWLAIAFGTALLLALIGIGITFQNAQNANNQSIQAQETAAAETNLRATQQAIASENDQLRATQQAIASQKETEARSLDIASAARRASRNNDSETAITLALTAYQQSPTLFEVQRTLREVAFVPGVVATFAFDSDYTLGPFVSFSQDGRIMLMTSRTYPVAATFVQVWDIDSKDILLEIDLPEAASALLTPDGKYSIIYTYKQTGISITLWNNETGVKHDEFEFDSAGISVSPDSRWLAFTLSDQTIIWDIKNGVEHSKFDRVSSLSFSSDGSKIAFSPRDYEVCIWNVELNIEQGCIGSADIISEVQFSPSNQLVAFYNKDYPVYGVTVINVQSMEVVRRVEFESTARRYGQSLAFSQDDTTLFVGTDRALIVWDIASGRKVQQIDLGDEILDIHFARPSEGLASIAVERVDHVDVYIYELTSGLMLLEQQVPNYRNGIFLPGKLVVAASITNPENSAVSLYSLAYGPYSCNIFVPSLSATNSGSGNRSLMVTGSQFGEINLWNTEQCSKIYSIQAANSRILDISVSPSGNHMLTVSEDSTLIEWNISTLTKQIEFDTEGVQLGYCNEDIFCILYVGGRIQCCFISVISANSEDSTLVHPPPIGLPFATSLEHNLLAYIGFYYDDNSVVQRELILWNPETNQVEYRFPTTDNTAQLAFIPNSNLIAIVLKTGAIDFFDFKTRTQTSFLSGYSSITQISVNFDGTLLAFTTEDQELHIWDILRNTELHSLTGVNNAYFSSNSSNVISIIHRSGHIQLWDVAPILDVDSLLTWIYHNRVLRNLECTERLQYRITSDCSDESDQALPPLPTPRASSVPSSTGIPTIDIRVTSTAAATLNLTAIAEFPSPTSYITNTPTITPTAGYVGQLAIGDTVYGYIDKDSRDAWTFYGERGQIIHITMKPEKSGIDTYLELYSVNGQLLKENDENAVYTNYADMWLVELAETGIYTIIARLSPDTLSYNPISGGYKLELFEEDVP